MKKLLSRMLIFVLILCMVAPMTAMAANSTTYIVMTFWDDEKEYTITGESSHYLTEDANLLTEVVAFINENYYGNGKMYNYKSPAMQDIMDEGLAAYKRSDSAWESYVDKYYEDVDPETGDVNLKGILRDKDSVLGDLEPNVKHSITFQNTVRGDRKYGVTYTFSIVRYVGDEGPAAALNMNDHFAYIKGYNDGSVHPNGNITREETATIFYRLLTEESRSLYETSVSTFTDVNSSRWSCTAIATMANAGIVNGYNDGSFGPGKNITRAEFAAIAARFDSSTYDGPNLFPDINGHWAANEINRAAQKGWVKGDNQGNFRPNDPITRAEAVTLINRVLNRLPETEEDLLDGMITFTDNLNPNAWYYLAIQEAANGHDYVRKEDAIHETWTALENK